MRVHKVPFLPQRKRNGELSLMIIKINGEHNKFDQVAILKTPSYFQQFTSTTLYAISYCYYFLNYRDNHYFADSKKLKN